MSAAMRFPLLAFLISTLGVAMAQTTAPADGGLAGSFADLSPREAALEHLLSERGSADSFAAVVEEARKQGVGGQAILEARFLFHVDRQEDAAIAAMLPEFMARRDTFRLEDSEIFSLKEDWLAVTEYVQAIAALKKGDKDAFKKHITEAFWLSPRQGSAFAPHIDRVRLEEAMSAVRIDFTTRLADLTGSGVVVLGDLMAGKKAMLLHFWSPWSHECEAAMPDFVATAHALEKKGISVVSLVADDSPKGLTDARELIRPIGPTPPGAWLVDPKKNSLNRLLRIQSVPAAVLVSPEGRVLFNGHPTDDNLWRAIQRLDPSIARPASERGREEP